MNSEKAFELHQKILNLGKQMNIGFFELAGIFKTIRDEKIYKDLGYGSFKEYLALPEMPYELPTVYSYIRIREVILELEIDPGVLEEITYVKFRALIPYITKDNKEELLAQAKTLSSSDFKKLFADKKKNEGFEDERPIPKVFRCKDCGKVKWDALPEEICPGHN